MASIDYQYTLASTESTTGYFSCEPPPDLSFADALTLLEHAPNDDFLHRHLLRILLDKTSSERDVLSAKKHSPVLGALLAEAALLQGETHPVAPQEALRTATPLPYLEWAHATQENLEEQRGIETWNDLFNANLTNHHALPHPDDTPLPAFVRTACAVQHEKTLCTVPEVYAQLVKTPDLVWSRPPAQETAARALANLASAGVIAGIEMRHEASLSPIALLRRWTVDTHVQSGALNYTLRGEATTWGRGLSLADARASYAMEMIERASAYLSIEEDHLVGRAPGTPDRLIKARRSELLAQGHTALDPNVLPVAVPYQDQALYWMWGQGATANGYTDTLVPVQAVGLFCNLDEPTLFLSPGSTGLASGNTLEEAKVAALTEVLERDAEATVPWNRSRCFALLPPKADTASPHLAALLADYAARGIQIRFMDMTTEFGLPSYQCFVRHPDRRLIRGTGAGLCAQRALLSALTETPYPYPYGPASVPTLDVPARHFDALPDYRLESPRRNLTLLETVLLAHKRPPVYVTLTREDLEFPVVRALVPGLELTADHDRFTRPPLRLFARYLADKA
ncbi:MAG: YcaO-like family protein [Bilophila sp.]